MMKIKEIRLMLKAWRLYKNAKEAYKMTKTEDGVKSGKKTSEFWGKVVVQLIAFVGGLSGIIDPELAILIVGLLEGLYAIARAIVKYKGGTLPDLEK